MMALIERASGRHRDGSQTIRVWSEDDLNPVELWQITVSDDGGVLTVRSAGGRSVQIDLASDGSVFVSAPVAP
ncbi:hypothetical protein [Branchiibius sp. NY16-3462-2]|uniref:hypothetical protein n=1 Tax=Branchiibius sp. NY16-3462-2 TaxID=1807500 RepID=UPI0025BBD411|nr:hypothetical protein [Branchiibius sp. NY16-3462-2]